MRQAIACAKDAMSSQEVPVGAVIIQDNKIIARAHNLTLTHHDPTAHAELIAIRMASKKINNERLLHCSLYVSLEPCAMCAGAIIQARIPLVVYGASDPKAGACGSVLQILPNKKLNHRPIVISHVLAEDSSQLLKVFFRKRR